jgi:hypothetical protein
LFRPFSGAVKQGENFDVAAARAMRNQKWGDADATMKSF